jgi:acyl-CoA reductase-like NAD-dependent aldehyde dehydrogenase
VYESSRQSQTAIVKLYVDAMDSVVVEVSADGRVRLENEDWSRPTLQERRAILFAAATAIEELTELVEILQDGAAE